MRNTPSTSNNTIALRRASYLSNTTPSITGKPSRKNDMPTLHNKQGKVLLRTEIITRESLMRVCQLIIASSGESQRAWAAKIEVSEQTLSNAINHAAPAKDYVRERIISHPVFGLREHLVKTARYIIADEGESMNGKEASKE